MMSKDISERKVYCRWEWLDCYWQKKRTTLGIDVTRWAWDNDMRLHRNEWNTAVVSVVRELNSPQFPTIILLNVLCYWLMVWRPTMITVSPHPSRHVGPMFCLINAKLHYFYTSFICGTTTR